MVYSGQSDGRQFVTTGTRELLLVEQLAAEHRNLRHRATTCQQPESQEANGEGNELEARNRNRLASLHRREH